MREGYKSGREFHQNALPFPNLFAKWPINFLSQIKVNSLFDNYRIQSNANNEITMALSSEALLGALRSATASSSASSSFDAEEVVMKLAKKNDQALLSFEISGQSRVGNRLRVAHDVRIEVMKPADVAKMTEPLCPTPDVRFLLLFLAENY
jgi:HUS1 checkpoint protein